MAVPLSTPEPFGLTTPRVPLDLNIDLELPEADAELEKRALREEVELSALRLSFEEALMR